MKLLIITQKVDINDAVLGFMHGWIEGFAKKSERVTVICLEKGEHCLPGNVRIFSLGKERGNGRFAYLYNFYRFLWQERKNYDTVFVHMNYEYVILGGIIWRILGKKVSLWYAHGYAPAGLKIAEKLAETIFTSTKSGCRVKSQKIRVIGQGINAEKFKVQNSESRLANRNKIITIGRISPSKDYHTLISAVQILKEKGLPVRVKIVGGPATDNDKNYFDQLQKAVKDKELTAEIEFIGPVANIDILDYLSDSALFVNMGQTGSLDKAMLEAMAAGLPIITCNEAMEEVLGKYIGDLMYKKKDSGALVQKIENIIKLPAPDYGKISDDMRKIVLEGHDLKNFIGKVLAYL